MNSDPKLLKNMPLLITRGSYIFPSFEQVLEVGRKKSIEAIRDSIKNHEYKIILTSQKRPLEEDVTKEDIHNVGILASFSVRKEWEDGSFTANFKSIERVKINNVHEDEMFQCDAEVLDSFVSSEDDITVKITENMKDLLEVQEILPEDLLEESANRMSSSNIVDTIAQFLPFLKMDKKQQILEELDVNKRLDKIFEVITSKKQDVDLEKKITKKIKDRVDEQQREFYLREKLKAIKDELGDGDEGSNDMNSYKLRLEKEPFPAHIKKRILSEIGRYEQIPAASSESNMIRSYIDWMMAIPWHEKSKERYNLKSARKILDKYHFGLEKVKDRIIEYLAAKSMTKSLKGEIICLVGPPGVGKTSLAKSIAESIGRNFVKVSLGGVKDEAEIRGHRKTYIGSLPGRIIQTMKRAKTLNPLFLLDEIDKMASDYRGDPASAMLEVLDPEQNKIFSDHYIEEDYDLSDVMFIATANYYENIPEALIDRMEIIQLFSYTELEKLKIANDYLIPKVLIKNGLADGQLKFKKNALDEIIKNYTREAGVRQLERSLNSVARKFIVKLLNKELNSLEVDDKIVREYLGKRLFEHTLKEEKSDVGVVTGLAYTQFGGDILPIEINHFKGKGNLVLTGKLGEVMKESASIALDYVKANTKQFGIDDSIFENIDIHIHVPEGAVPKDGPSAGITITTALISALTNTPVSKEIGMTGEITLRGKVLPIGGLREKLISARRSGLKNIIVPKQNEKDLDDIPKEVLTKLNISFAKQYQDVYNFVFKEKKN